MKTRDVCSSNKSDLNLFSDTPVPCFRVGQKVTYPYREGIVHDRILVLVDQNRNREIPVSVHWNPCSEFD